MPETFNLVAHAVQLVIALIAVGVSIWSIKKAQDNRASEAIDEKIDGLDEAFDKKINDLTETLKEHIRDNTEEIEDLKDTLKEHDKEDAASFSTIRARLHNHRVLLRFLQTVPERLRVLEYKARINSPTETPSDDEEEDKL